MTHPLIVQAQRAAEHLAPLAAEHERRGVGRTTLDGLAAAGLYGILGPEEVTGTAP